MHVLHAIQMERTKEIIMWRISILMVFLFLATYSYGQNDQDKITGTISYKTSANIYVRFNTTDEIKIGDTLFILKNNVEIPAIVVNQKSSISAVGASITGELLNKNDILYKKNIKKGIPDQRTDSLPVTIPVIVNNQDSLTLHDAAEEKKTSPDKKQIVSGRISLSTNASINPGEFENHQRYRASFSLNVINIDGSAFSVHNYMTYRYRFGIDQQTNFANDFKIFTLAANYNPNDKVNLWVGRKINNTIANIGAIDGLQYEYKSKEITGGIFAGTRPDFTDYTFNEKLLQLGGYVSHQKTTDAGYIQTSLAFAEQRNAGNTDRRFLYFQHNNNYVKNLNVFFSSELDMYQKINDVKSNNLELTSIYVSARYRIRKNLSVSASYDKRRNIIFYESFQTYLEQLLAQETRQGLRFQVMYSPLKFLSLNVSQFLRYEGSGKPTTNTYGNVSIFRFPTKNTTTSISINTLESYYHKAVIYGGRVSQNIFHGKAQLELNYRNMNYKYSGSEFNHVSNIIGASFNMIVVKNTSFIISYEGTFEKQADYNRYFVTLTHRIKSKKK